MVENAWYKIHHLNHFILYSSVVLTTFTLLCNRSLEIFHVKLKLCTHWTTPQFSLSQTPGSENSTLFLCILTTLDNSYKSTYKLLVILWHFFYYQIISDQSCLTLCNPMNRSTPGLPVHQQLTEFTETHVHRVSDAIQPSHPLLSPSPPAPNSSQHQSLF